MNKKTFPSNGEGFFYVTTKHCLTGLFKWH